MKAKHLFVDTSALIALLNPRDQNHSQILSYLEKQEGPFQGVTTNLVMTELLSFFSRHGLLTEAIRFQEKVLESPDFQVIWVDSVLHQQSIKTLEKFSDHKISFTDAVSMTVMKREKLSHALAFDDDFVKAGFEVLP